MKAIIMCAGKSTRTQPLTCDTPKPLLKILDKTVLEHSISAIKDFVEEIILVVGFMKEDVIRFIKENYANSRLKFHFAEQIEQKGTGHAVLICKEFIKEDDKVLILNGDDLYAKEDLTRLLEKKSGSLAQEVDNPENFGIFSVDEKNLMTDLVEKPQTFIGNLANIGCYLVTEKIFKYLENVKESPRGEIELTEGVLNFVKGEKIEYHILKVETYWLPLIFPWSYIDANTTILDYYMSKRKNESKKLISDSAKIHESAVLIGDVIVEDGAEIQALSYIEGPAYVGKESIVLAQAKILQNSVIMNNCQIGCEVSNSVIMDDVKAKHFGYIGNSVIGKKTNISAGTITSNFRHDGKNHMTIINGKKTDSHRRKLGAFLGTNVRTGVGTKIYPGRKIWPNLTTLPGEVVEKDKRE